MATTTIAPKAPKTAATEKNGKATKPVPSANGKPAASTKAVKSKRLRLFELLAKKPGGLGNAEIRAALNTESIASICRDEAIAGRLKATVEEGRTGKIFSLSASGRKALEKGTVDSAAAPKAEWKN